MQTYSQQFLPALQVYQEELLQRLELLVNIDSGTGQIEGINPIMSYMEQWVCTIGCSVTLHDSEYFGHTLGGRLKGNGRVRLLLVGHLDTVYEPGEATPQPFQIRDGLAYGP